MSATYSMLERVAKRSRLARMMKNQNGHCSYCNAPMLANPIAVEMWRKATIDHLIPKSKGGTNTAENLVAACWRCNQEKGDMTETEFRNRKRRSVAA